MHLAKDDAVMVWGLLGLGIVAIILAILFAYQPPALQTVGEQINNQTHNKGDQENGTDDDDTPPLPQNFTISNGDQFRLSDRLLITPAITSDSSTDRPRGSSGGGSGGGGGGGSSSRDRTPPSVMGVFSRPNDTADGWYTNPFKVTWVGKDDRSGIDFCDDPTNYSGPDGRSIELEGHCTDNAGNEGTGEVTFNYNSTRFAPFFSYSLTISDDTVNAGSDVTATAATNNTSVVQVTFSWKDPTGATVSNVKQVTGSNLRTAIDVFSVPDRAGLWTLSAHIQNVGGHDMAMLEEDFLVLVPPVTNLAYTLTLDKEAVVVGDIITATAVTNDTGTENVTFVWIDPEGDIKESQARPVGTSGEIEASFVPDEQGQWRVGAQFNENTVRSKVFMVQERDTTNHSPVAINDAIITSEDVVVIINATGNDFDLDGDRLSAILNDGPTAGTLTMNANGSYTYIPGANFSGADSLTYHANDGSANSNVATVSIAVNAVNDPPVADAGPDQNVSEESEVSLNGSASDVDDIDLIFSWSQVSGPASVALIDADTLSASIIAPSINHSDLSSLQITLTFELVVTDAHGAHFTDTVAVVINDVNKAPSVNAGQDQIVHESILCEEKGECDDDDDHKEGVIASGKHDDDSCKEKKDDALIESTAGDKDDEKCEILTVMRLFGSASDADGDFLTFLWDQTDGTSVELSDVNSSTASFIAPEVDEDTHLKFALIVNDCFGGFDTDTVDILVLDDDGGSHKKNKVTGGGSISKNVNFGFEVKSKDGEVKGEMEFQDKEEAIELHSISITSLTVSEGNEKAAFEGIGKIDGKEYEFTVEVEDNGKGKKDNFTIEMPERNYRVTGTLSGGNIQIHH